MIVGAVVMLGAFVCQTILPILVHLGRLNPNLKCWNYWEQKIKVGKDQSSDMKRPKKFEKSFFFKRIPVWSGSMTAPTPQRPASYPLKSLLGHNDNQCDQKLE